MGDEPAALLHQECLAAHVDSKSQDRAYSAILIQVSLALLAARSARSACADLDKVSKPNVPKARRARGRGCCKSETVFPNKSRDSSPHSQGITKLKLQSFPKGHQLRRWTEDRLCNAQNVSFPSVASGQVSSAEAFAAQDLAST